MTTIHRLEVGKRLSEVAIHGGTIYLAGQVPEKTVGQDIRAQTAEVLSMIDRLLMMAGSDKSKILMSQIFLVDLEDFPGLNEVWDAWVVPGQTPPRATVQAKLAKPEWKLEIVITAAVA